MGKGAKAASARRGTGKLRRLSKRQVTLVGEVAQGEDENRNPQAPGPGPESVGGGNVSGKAGDTEEGARLSKVPGSMRRSLKRDSSKNNQEQ